MHVDSSSCAEATADSVFYYPAELPAELLAELVRFFDNNEAYCLGVLDYYYATYLDPKLPKTDEEILEFHKNMNHAFYVGKVSRNFLRRKNFGWSEEVISVRWEGILRAAWGLAAKPQGITNCELQITNEVKTNG